MTKRLSEIGYHVYVEAQPPACRILAYIEFSPDERREFAYELIRAWERTRWTEQDVPKLEKFLEENGL